MNDICNSCYSNSTLGATSRNLNIEDIENILNISYWNPRTYDYNGYKTYTDSRKETTYKNYPYIWQYEEYADIDGISADDSRTIQILEGEGISRSTQPKNEDGTNKYYTESYFTAKSAITVKQTGWEKNLTNENLKDEKYYKLIVQQSENQTVLSDYLLGTRYCISLHTMNFYNTSSWSHSTR